MPEFALTRSRTVSPKVSISCPVALPVLMRKLQCISDTCAPPTRKPRQPAASTNFQALLPGGSTFKNPPGNSAWRLIDAAGCRGLRVGGAQVSEMHCNFLINTGSATGHDIETLGETVRERVKANSGIELHWEIKRIGIPV